MKRNRTLSSENIPDYRISAKSVVMISSDPSRQLPGVHMALVIVSSLLMLVSLLIPEQGLAFDFGNPFKDAAKAIQQKLDDLTKKHVDQGEKQVEETIDQSLGQQPNAPKQGSTPTQQSATGQSSASQVTTTVAVGGSLQAKIGEEFLGPYLDTLSGGRVFVSDDGGHVAIAMMKGSRQVMVVDGVEGPLFDEVAGGGIMFGGFPPQFDSTGLHCAYVGRRGDQFIAVIDGKEVGLGTWSGSSNVSPLGDKNPLFFNRDGSRIAYLSFVAGSPKTYWLNVNGRKSQGYAAIDTTQIRFAGKRLAYPAQTADGKWHVVVDGKLGPGYEKVRSLQWSADGSHYAYAANSDWKNAQVVVDGVAGKGYQPGGSNGIEALTFTADNRVVYAPAGGILVVGGQEITHEAQPFEFANINPFLIPSREIAGSGAPWFALSPDGQRFAYVKHLGSITSRATAAVVDGKVGLEYERISDIQFGPNGKRVAYIARKAGSTYVVVDGEESPGYSKVSGFRFSADGGHYAYEAFQGSGGRWVVVVDGKEGPVFQELIKGALTFSPNGRRYAYAGYSLGSDPQLIVDGEVAAQAYFGTFQEFNADPKIRRALDFPPLLFSPDGSRFAYITRQGGTSNLSLVIGNQTYPAGFGYSFPVFSPNSTHFATAVLLNRQLTILVDGRKGPVYDKVVQATDKVFRFIDDRTLRFLAIRDGKIYRVTIDVGS
jgi:WD40-like Beta Propeller Repeat